MRVGCGEHGNDQGMGIGVGVRLQQAPLLSLALGQCPAEASSGSENKQVMVPSCAVLGGQGMLWLSPLLHRKFGRQRGVGSPWGGGVHPSPFGAKASQLGFHF